ALVEAGDLRLLEDGLWQRGRRHLALAAKGVRLSADRERALDVEGHASPRRERLERGRIVRQLERHPDGHLGGLQRGRRAARRRALDPLARDDAARVDVVTVVV